MLLRHLLGQHEVVTVAHMGWASLKKGELLRTAEDKGIDVFLTEYGSLSYERNLAERRLAVVALSAIELPRELTRQATLSRLVACNS